MELKLANGDKTSIRVEAFELKHIHPSTRGQIVRVNISAAHSAADHRGEIGLVTGFTHSHSLVEFGYGKRRTFLNSELNVIEVLLDDVKKPTASPDWTASKPEWVVRIDTTEDVILRLKWSADGKTAKAFGRIPSDESGCLWQARYLQKETKPCEKPADAKPGTYGIPTTAECAVPPAPTTDGIAIWSKFIQHVGRANRTESTPTLDQRLLAIGMKHESVIPQIEAMRKTLAGAMDTVLNDPLFTGVGVDKLFEMQVDIADGRCTTNVSLESERAHALVMLTAFDTAIAVRDAAKVVKPVREPARMEPLEVLFDVNGDDDL